MENKKYKYGQILEFAQDTEIEGLFGDIKVCPKGTKVMIGVDGLAHHLRGGYIQPLAEHIKNNIEGYDTKAICEVMCSNLNSYFNLEDFLEGYDINKEDFISEMEYALNEWVGM